MEKPKREQLLYSRYHLHRRKKIGFLIILTGVGVLVVLFTMLISIVFHVAA